MRLGNKRKPDYEVISRRSVAKDFYPERIHIIHKKVPEKRNSREINIPKQQEQPEEGQSKRISTINPICMYSKYARFFVGKLVRLISKKGEGDSTTGWYEFVHDEDRKALNEAAGWSDNKKMYLLERPKFK